MARTTLMKKAFNWGDWLTVPEVQSLIILTAWQPAGRLGAGTESALSCRHQEVD